MLLSVEGVGGHQYGVGASGSSDQDVRGVWMCLFKAVPMRPSAAVSNFGGRSYRSFISKLFWRPQGPLIRMYGVCLDASFHGGSNDKIGGH